MIVILSVLRRGAIKRIGAKGRHLRLAVIILNSFSAMAATA